MVLFLPDPSFGHFTRMGSIVLKLCIYALVDILITKMVFFPVQSRQENKIENRPSVTQLDGCRVRALTGKRDCILGCRRYGSRSKAGMAR